MNERIKVTRSDGWAEVRLNRPEALNAVDPAMLNALLAELQAISRERDIKAVVISAEGRAFSAGADIDTVFFMEPGGADEVPVPQEWESPFYGADLLEWQHMLIKQLWHLPQLTIAAVKGACVGGGGFGLAMACDLRYAAPDARFWMIPSNVNVVQDWGLAWFLQRAIGPVRTAHAYFSGEPIEAHQAEAWGIVARIADDPDEAARALAGRVGGMGRHAVKYGKALLRRCEDLGLEDELTVEAVNNSLHFISEEFKTRKAAYLTPRGRDAKKEARPS